MSGLLKLVVAEATWDSASTVSSYLGFVSIIFHPGAPVKCSSASAASSVHRDESGVTSFSSRPLLPSLPASAHDTPLARRQARHPRMLCRGAAEAFTACRCSSVVPPPGLPESQCRFRAVRRRGSDALHVWFLWSRCLTWWRARLSACGIRWPSVARSALTVRYISLEPTPPRDFSPESGGSFKPPSSSSIPYFLHFIASPGSCCNRPKDIWQVRIVSWNETLVIYLCLFVLVTLNLQMLFCQMYYFSEMLD